jgi:hypothetical protein
MDGYPHRPAASRFARAFHTTVSAATLAACCVHAEPVFPERLPDPQIVGFTFPESEATLTRWITEWNRADAKTAAVAFERIHLHGWGLWTALTADTRQTYEGQPLRVFETWLTLEELADASTRTIAHAAVATSDRAAPRRTRSLEITSARPGSDPRFLAEAGSTVDRVTGFVKFDPSAADHILAQQLLRKDALDALLDGGAAQVPPFPASALAIKPVFQFIRQKNLVQGRYHALKAWPGPPPAARPWAPAHWPGTVWIDVGGGGSGRGATDNIALPDGSTRADETTYAIDRLLHHRLSAADAASLNEDPARSPVSAGDVAILVAMHVTGREIARWTWQTFWWSPSPDEPLAPSSPAIASLRPPQLRGAARNYAMSLAYMMLSPDQPYVGGSNRSPAVYAYNPWLEAKLAPADLPYSIAGLAPDGRPAANNHGVQTNCMSCHANANYNPRALATAPGFSGARYVDLGAAEFVGTLQVDFLWSLARHAR